MSDSEEDSVASDHEEEVSDKSPPHPTPEKSLKRHIDEDDDEEDEEEEEEEEEEEDEDRNVKRSKRKRSRRRVTARDFIQDDVEVDDDEDEEDYDVGGEDGDVFGVDPNERAEAERFLREQEKSRERRRNKYADMTEEEMERYFQERHAAQLSTHRGGDVDDDSYDDITQNGLLPSTKDPNLWTVKCMRMGEEKIVALQLMRKFITYQSTDNPLQIKSVIVKEGIKGLIYIEAFKKSHVLTAIEGVSALNGYKIAMVPIKEMVDTLKVVKDIPTLKPGSYVRLKRTMYKDDLAQVDWVDIAQNRVNLKLVPRVDYTRMRGALRNQEDRTIAKTKRRAQPRLFDVEKIKQIGGEVANDGDFVIFEGGHYRRGFLYKSFPMDAVIADGVKPSFTELERFQESADDLRKELEGTLLKEKGHNFAPGDNIEVTDGELVNLRGKVISVDGDKVVIMPDHEDLTESLTLNAHEIRKFFKEGDHVRVVNGRYEGDTGLILKVEENLVILLSDLTRDELKVLPKDVQLCADVATGVDSIGQYQYQDLVMLDQETVGVIVRLEREHVEVLTMHGKSVRIKPQSIQSKKDSRFLKALDANKNSIQQGDLVRVVDGPHANKREMDEEKQGEVKHIYRTWAFLYSRKHTMHGGIFVCKARQLSMVGAKSATDSPHSGRGSAPIGDLLRSPHPLNSPHPGALTPAQSISSRGIADAPSAREVSPLNMFGGAPSVRRDTALIGKSVRIVMGPMKTYTGIVKDATEASVRLELHAMPKIINIDRSKVMVVGGDVAGSGGSSQIFGAATPSATFDNRRTPMYSGAQTPMYGAGAQTPLPEYGSRTPHYGMMTPAYDGGAGSRTPSHGNSWDPRIANTPAHSGGFQDEFGAGDGGADSNSGGFGATLTGFGASSASSGFGATSASAGFGASSASAGFGASSASSGFGNNGFNATPASQHGQTPTGSVASGMYSDYAAASPFPRSNFDSTAASPFAAHQGPSTVPDSYLKNGEWCAIELNVQVRRSYQEEDIHGIEGSVRAVMDGKCRVYFDETDEEREVPFEYLLPVKPKQNDQAKIVFGNTKDTAGTVVSVDGQEAVLRASNGEMRAYPISLMCKFC